MIKTMQSQQNQPTEFVAGPEHAGERIDRVLSALPQVGSRSAAARLIDSGGVEVDGQAVRKSHTVAAGERVVIRQRAVEVDSGRAAVEFAIVYQDDHLLVVDKPAGLVVHPGPGNRTGTLSQALAGLAGGGDPDRPGIVHRLDKETSGLLVVARDEQTLRELQAALQRREISREYTALVKGAPETASGTIDAPLGRDRRNPELISLRGDSERPAITHFDVSESLPGRSLLAVRLETGRTHQIRVHLAAIGLPVCGDPTYGVAGDLGLSRQFLHASRLSFVHPTTGEQVSIASELPADLSSALELARASG